MSITRLPFTLYDLTTGRINLTGFSNASMSPRAGEGKLDVQADGAGRYQLVDLTQTPPAIRDMTEEEIAAVQDDNP